MLISMPTGTSTIFGAFQAILALHLNSDVLRPLVKVARIEKFASEIFFSTRCFMLQCERNSRFCAGVRQNNAGIHGFIVAAGNPEADAGLARRSTPEIKSVWDAAGAGPESSQEVVVTHAAIFLQYAYRR
jgi:hypothetical protein